MAEKTAFDVQSDFAEALAFKDKIIWDFTEPDDAYVIKRKIEILLPENEENKKKIKQMRSDLFDNVWEQRKYSSVALYSATIFVLVAETVDPPRSARTSTKFSIHPVFRTEKCRRANGNSSNCCMVFIDEYSRVYKNWKSFIENNNYPKGVLIAPANGLYQIEDNEVKLEYHLTPAALPGIQLISCADTLAAASSIMLLPLAAAAFMPVAAPVLGIATACLNYSAAFSAVRSVWRLKDRVDHSMPMKNTETAMELLSAASFVGMHADKVSSSVMRVAKRKPLHGAKMAAQILNVSSVVISGCGASVTIYDIYKKQELTVSDIMQLSSHIFIFTNSANNMKIIQTIKTRGSRATLKVLKDINKQLFRKVPLKNFTTKNSFIKMYQQKPRAPDSQYDALDVATFILKIVQEYGEDFVRYIQDREAFYAELREYVGDKFQKIVLDNVKNILNKITKYLENLKEEYFMSADIILQKVKNFVPPDKALVIENFRKDLEEKADKWLEEFRSFLIRRECLGRNRCDSCGGVFDVCNL